MYNIKLYRDASGKLIFESSNENGRLVDISREKRAKAMPYKKLIKNGKLIKNNLYLCRSDMIMDLTKKEDKTIDALYSTYKDQNLIIVPHGCITSFDL